MLSAGAPGAVRLEPQEAVCAGGQNGVPRDKGLSPADVWGILEAIVKYIGGKDGYYRNRM